MAQEERARELAQLPQLAQQYLAHVATQKRLAERTVALYTEDLKKLTLLAEQSRVGLPDVTSLHTRRWVMQMHAQGRTPRGIALILSGWRGFYKWAGKNGFISVNPLDGVRAPKPPKPLPKALAVDDAVALAAHRDADRNPWAEARDALAAELLYSSGLRIAELLSLDVSAGKGAVSWIDVQAATATVTGKGSKQRTVPVGRPALDALAAWLSVRDQGLQRGFSPSTALFINVKGERLSPQTIRVQLKRRAQSAGLNSPVHPHMLRHSFASHVLQSSGDLRAVQELLGHSNITTTQVYTRLDFQHLAKVYDQAHPRAKLKR
jgi:integrase/recombinase XerC